jgi:alkyl hydroperoxide reductase subunit F
MGCSSRFLAKKEIRQNMIFKKPRTREVFCYNQLTYYLIMKTMYDLVIIGGGPAGVAAGVYASRKQLKTLFVTESFGGQSIVSEGIENWIGEIKISGLDLAKKLENHLEAYADDIVDIKKGYRVSKVTKNSDSNFSIEIKQGENVETFESKSVLVTTGSNRRRLPAEGADKFEHKGLTYCASCDGPLFRDKDVVVIGGGNSAFESAAQLLAYCSSVTLIHRRDEFRADPVTIEALKKDPKFKIITNAEITEVTGEVMVNGLKYLDNNSGAEKEMSVSGIFVEIGAVPAVSFVSELVDLADDGSVKIDPWNQKTSMPGIWAAGDCTNILYHQNNIAAGDAVRALEDIYLWLKSQ